MLQRDESSRPGRGWIIGSAAVAVVLTASAFAGPGSTGATDAQNREVAILAGGCFWGMQGILRKIPGVIETEVGYTGGWVPNPRYEDTHDSKSGHAEAVRIVFDPHRLSYADLLEKWFFRMHDPTTPSRPGAGPGSWCSRRSSPGCPRSRRGARRHNQQRLHSTPGYASPAAFESMFLKRQAA